MSIEQLLRAVDEADSSEGLIRAVRNLAQSGDEMAIPMLIKVLGFNNPGAAIAAVDGLVKCGEAAVLPLLNLDGYNYGARAWAIRGLAMLGDPRGLEVLLNATEHDFALSVRRAAAKGLGNIHWQKLSDDQVLSAQFRVYETLMKAVEDPEWVVRYAGIVALESLAKSICKNPPIWGLEIGKKLQEISENDSILGVRARALWGRQCLRDLYGN